MSASQTKVSLPKGWRWFRLEDLVGKPKADIVDGPFGSNLKASEYVPEGIPILRLQNVEPNHLVQKNIKFVTSAKAAELQRHTFQAGDLILTKLGDPLGEACIVPESLEFGVIVADLVRVRLNSSRALLEAVCYAINSAPVQRQFEEQTKGTTRPRVNLSHIRGVRLPLPVDLADQRALVAEIEKQFTRLDAAVASLKRVQAALKRYRASVLKAACEGRLVPTEVELACQEGRAYEPASELLVRILQERHAQWEFDQLPKPQLDDKAPNRGRWKSTYKEPPEVKMVELPKLPEGWGWCLSDSLFTFVTSGSRGWAKYYSDDGAVFLRIGNLDHDSISLDLGDIRRVNPPAGAEGTRTKVEAGDFLISITADVGMIAVAPRELGEAYINQHVALARPVATICKKFVAWYLAATHGGQKQFLRLQRGATKVGLGLDDIRAVPIPLPPLVEQERIVAEVERRFSVIEEVEAVVAANLKRAERLRQSILHRAFTGEL